MPVASCKAAPCTTACVVAPCSLSGHVWCPSRLMKQCTPRYLVLWCQRILQMWGSPDGSSPDLDKLGGRCSTLEDKVNEISLRLAQFLALAQSVSNSTVTFRRSPTVWTFFPPESQESSKTSPPSRPVSSLRKLEMGPLQASLDNKQDLGPCLDTLVVPLLPGPVTQVQRTTTGICDENSKQTPMMKTREAPFSCASHARKVVQAFPRGSLKEFQHRRKITKSNARAAARRLELFLPPKPCASDSWHNSRMMALRYSVDSSL